MLYPHHHRQHTHTRCTRYGLSARTKKERSHCADTHNMEAEHHRFGVVFSLKVQATLALITQCLHTHTRSLTVHCVAFTVQKRTLASHTRMFLYKSLPLDLSVHITHEADSFAVYTNTNTPSSSVKSFHLKWKRH